MKNLFVRLFVKKNRKKVLTDFAVILKDIPKINTVEGCYKGCVNVAEFTKQLKNDDPIKEMCGKLVEYLMDTKDHIKDGYHRSSQSEWKTKNTYPDINEYIDIGVRIKNF